MKKFLVPMSLMALLFSTGCQHEKHGAVESEARFLVSSPLKMDTSMTKNYVCQIHSIQHIELRSQERGYLQHIFVDEGQTVKKGQLLFQIMPLLYQAELQKAEAEVELARIEYQNTKLLADSNVVSVNELAMAKAKFDKARAELALAQLHLDFTEIRAPFDGIMGRQHVRLGSLIDEGELLTSLSDNSKMWVYFNVPEAEYLEYSSKVKKDSLIAVQLLMANNRIFKHSGYVTTIESDFNNATGNIAFRATFPNPEGLLRHGETGSILMTEPLKNALLIPQKATYEILDKKYVFVVGEDHVLRSRPITISEEMTHIYALKEGLTEKDHILLEGLRLVKENEKIEVEYLRPDSAIYHLELYAE
jgi:membrane fusion protein (multidrug efflux system)